MIYVQRSLSGSIVQKTLVFNSEEEFTAFENQRRKEFGKNWCLFDETDPHWDFCTQAYFNFINVKDPVEKYGKLEDLFAEFILRHKQSLMFYHNLTCWEDKNGDHYGNIPELEKLTDEELIDKEWEACGEPSVHTMVRYPDPTVIEYIPDKPKSLKEFAGVADFTDFGGVASPVERIAPDGSKDYVVTMNCGV